MSAVVDAISDAIDTVVAVTVTVLVVAFPVTAFILASVSEDLKEFILDQLAVVMSWFGITDQDIIETFVSDQRLMPDTDTSNFLTQLALKHEITQRNIIDLFATMTANIRGSFNKYYDNGINEYTPGLPQADIHTEYVPTNLNTYVDLEYGITSFMETYDLKVPTKEEYLTYVLHNDYNYYPQSSDLTYLGELCPVTLMEYNYTSNEYDIHITRGTHKVTETTITITPYVEAYAVYNDTTQYNVGDHVMYDPGTGSVAYKCILASLGNLPTDGTYWLQVDYDNKHTYTTEVTSYDTGGIISTVVTEDSNVLITAGSESNSFVSDTPGIAGTANYVLHEAAFPASRHFVVRYYDSALTSADWLYWVYRIGSGTYPTLDDANTSTSNLEMLPIIEIRRGTVNINNDPLSAKYLEAKAILGTIGLDVDELVSGINDNPSIANIEDAYVYFGLDLKEDSPLVAKMVYDLFEFMYYDVGLAVDEGGYKAIISEGAFNAALVWQQQTRTVTNGTIGPIGTTTITASDNVLVRKQETADQYVTYTMYKMASFTLIDREGIWGVTTRTCNGDDSIVIPLSHFYIDNLTPLEQMDIFNRSLRLSIYSADVVHLDWYETPEFFEFIQIAVQVVGVVLFILSLPGGGQAGTTWMAVAESLLYAAAISYGITLALTYIFEHTDNDFLRALAVVGAIALGAAAGGMSEGQGFMEAFQLVSTTTAFATVNTLTMVGQLTLQESYGKLQEEVETFQKTAEAKYDELEKMADEIAGGVSTEFITLLMNVDPIPGYIEGVELSRYQASNDYQTNFGALKGIPSSMIEDYYDIKLRKGALT